MEQEYLRELFSFQVEHKNYTNAGADLFQIEPTELGAKILNSYGLYFKPQDHGFVIAAPCILHTDSGLLELKKDFVGNVKLSFAVFTGDKYFFDHCKLPYDPPGEYVYYFNNLNPSERRTKLLLNNYSIKESERVKLHTKEFSGPLVRDDANQYVIPQVFDCRNQIVSDNQYDLVIDESKNTYYLSLARMADGLYTVEYNGELLTAYCAKASFIRRIPLLILEIFTDPDLPEQFRISKVINGVQYLDYKQFCLHFGFKLCYWRYKIIPVNLPSNTWIKLQTNQSGSNFKPEMVRIHNCQDYVLFTSEAAIEIPNEGLVVNLYRLNWDNKCRLSYQKYQHCKLDFWVGMNNDCWCREMCPTHYEHKCPARFTEELIGPLPNLGGESTSYYTENNQQFAELTLYLIYKNGSYTIVEDYQPPATGDFNHCSIEYLDDAAIQFVNKADVTSVNLHYYIPGKISQQDVTMNKLGNVFTTDKIVKRASQQHKITTADQIVYWFTYERLNRQKYNSDVFSHIFKSFWLN